MVVNRHRNANFSHYLQEEIENIASRNKYHNDSYNNDTVGGKSLSNKMKQLNRYQYEDYQNDDYDAGVDDYKMSNNNDQSYRSADDVVDNRRYNNYDDNTADNSYLPFEEQDFRRPRNNANSRFNHSRSNHDQQDFSKEFVEELLLEALMPAIGQWLDANIDRIVYKAVKQQVSQFSEHKLKSLNHQFSSKRLRKKN